MTTKTKPKIKDNNAVEVRLKEDEDRNEALALILLNPSAQAAVTIQQWENQSDASSMMNALSAQIDLVKDGNMGRPEAMLLAQAHTLDQLFNILAQRAYRLETVTSCEIHLRLAFKAQSQCRPSLETLAAIKNSPVIFAKQANISNGHQQINNGVSSKHAVKNKNQPNELCVRNNMAARNWMPEQRAEQSVKIKQWQPWHKSTGARTLEGKAISSRNAFKGGVHSLLRDIANLMRDQKDYLKRIKLN